MNLAHQYNPKEPLHVKIKAYLQQDSILVYVELKLNNTAPDGYRLEHYLVGSYQTKLDQTVLLNEVDSTFLGTNNARHYFKFVMPYTGQNFYVIRFISTETGNSYFYEHAIDSLYMHSFKLFDGQGMPIVKEYISAGNIHSTDSTTAVTYYNSEFPVALPPMVTNTTLPSRGLFPEEEFTLNGYLQKEGLYFLQSDTSANTGMGLLLRNNYYPRPSTLKELIEPLVYITSKEEKQKLNEITDKKSFDSFWLELTSSPERAKILIKSYYDRVTWANQVFTSFKEGWKTDRGMIYIIFGAPSKLIKLKDQEEWIYEEGGGAARIRFIFVKSPSVFSENYYVLVRKKSYDAAWFRTVDLWRKSRF